MKRPAVVFFIIVLAVSGGFFLSTQLEKEIISKTEESSGHPLDTHLSKKMTQDLDGILNRKYLRVLTTINKTNFYLSDGRLVGYEYSLLKEYEKYLNRRVKKNELKTVVEFVPVARDQLIPKLEAGYGDIAAAGLTITTDRLKTIDFTVPYLDDVDEIVVSPKGGFAPGNKYDLSGERVWVRQSSSYYESLQTLNNELRDQGQNKVKLTLVDENIETETLLEMVNSGAIAATVADSHIAMIWSKVLSNIELHPKAQLRTGARIAWGVRKDNPKLKNSLNTFLKKIKKGSFLGNIYFNRYYDNAESLKNPGGSENLEQVKKYKSLIQQYAKQYQFDWLLIVAVIFQESGFDHTQISHRGAVGLMQVLPSTANDKNINISKINLPENNIHAGVKYLAFLRNRYFSDKTIEESDRVRMILAAYNAGPAKIRKARALTRKMGLNRNKWFRNVEIGTLRLVGQEPVKYVSNINKYYILYKNMIEE